jgi:hypothetical protein
MLGAIRLAACFGLIACLSMSPAHAARRVALVIGNADYTLGPLANPVNDATAVAEALEKALGFEKVILRKNVTFDGFRAALRELAREVTGAELGVVYFAGHGIEVAGKNFLIPVDARLARSGDLSLEAISLDSVLEQLAGASRLKLVILDACRNNPFPVAGAKRAVSRGLSRIEPEDNTLVVYAAKDGTTADDGAGQRHSPFTLALLKHIATPGLEINFVFRRVRDDVAAATSPVQTPHVYGTLGGKELYLKPGLPKPTGETPAPSTAADVARICREVEGMSNPATLAVLERQHKGTPAGECVAARLMQLKRTADLGPRPKVEEDKRVIRRSVMAGGTGGTPFDEGFVNAQAAPVSSLTVTIARSVADRRQKLIATVQTHWAKVAGPMHGGAGGAVILDPETRTIDFDSDEPVRELTIFHRRFNWPDPAHAPVWVSGIRVRTAKRTYTFGDVNGTATECTLARGEQIVGFFGRAGAYVDALGCLIR